jgi:signal transduction histidine kinase
VANREIGGRSGGQPAVGPRSQTDTVVGARHGRGEAGERRRLQSRVAPIGNVQRRTESRPGPATPGLARTDEWRDLARDLHDGAQNELLSLILRIKLAEEDRDTPPALAATFVALEDHAAAALASLREIAYGIYPLSPVKLGLVEALRALAARAPIRVSIAGDAPRSTDEAEAAIYLCCSEAIQNVAKHAGPSAQVKLGLHHNHGVLAVRIEDDGRGFDPAQTPDGAGLRNIRERVHTLDGTLRLTSTPGHGTVLTISLPWPAAADGPR